MSNNQTQNNSDVEFLKWIYDLDMKFQYYSSLTVAPICFFFNSLAIIVFLSKKLKNTNWIQNIILNLTNNMVLVNIFIIFYTKSINKDILVYSNLHCKLLSFSIRVLVQQSSWIYVILAAERLLCVTYPNEYKSFKNKRLALVLVVGIVLALICILNIPNLFFNIETTTQQSISANQTLSSLACTSDALIGKIRNYVVIAFRMVIPFMLTMILNMILVVRLKNKRKTAKKSEDKFAFSIIVLNLLFIITLIPAIVAMIYSNVVSNTRQIAIANFMLHVSQVISSYNYGFNFFINLKTNILFRKQFLKFVFCKSL